MVTQNIKQNFRKYIQIYIQIYCKEWWKYYKTDIFLMLFQHKFLSHVKFIKIKSFFGGALL